MNSKSAEHRFAQDPSTDHAVNRYALALWICAVAAIIWGSLVPGEVLRNSPLGRLGLNDKIEHLAGYLVSASLAVLAFRNKAIGLGGAAAMMPLGVALEFAQRLVPGRSYEIGDMLADAAGIIAGIGIALVTRTAAQRLLGAD